MTTIKWWMVASLASVLVACGGGGGSAGSTGSSGTSGSSSETTSTTSSSVSATPASFVFSLDKTSITTSSSDAATLSITVLDSSRNVMSGVGVSVALDSGLYVASSTSTNSSGVASGKIQIGGDKSNRTINATITVGGVLSGTASVEVSGSQIAISTLPALPTPGQAVTVTFKATDAVGGAISGASINIGGTLGLTGSVKTNSSGSVSVAIPAAPSSPGTYTVTAGGLGVNSSQSVQVANSGAGSIPDAVGVVSSASLQIVPNSVSPNAANSTTNSAELTAKFQDASNQPISNIRVRFEIVAPGLGNGEQISTGTGTVYSSSSGIAQSSYIPGTRSSPTNGVTIRACYGSNDAAIAGGLCPSSVTQTLTVAGQPVSISLGFNNTLEKANNGLSYIQRFLALVTDSNGNPIANAKLSASVDISHYGKGYSYADNYYIGTTPYILAPDTSTAGITTTQVPVPGSTTPVVAGQRVWCPNEDTNRNGFLDAGEDINANGKLDSPKADVLLSFVGSNTTAADGTLQVQVQYPQNVATWLSFTIKVSAAVIGSEGAVSKSFLTGYIKGDETNGSFLTPPFGVGACTSPS